MSQPEIAKKSIKTLILVFRVTKGHCFWCQSKASWHQKPVYDFLLVINSNFGPYLTPFLRYDDLLAKNCKFSLPPSHLAPSIKMTPFKFM